MFYIKFTFSYNKTILLLQDYPSVGQIDALLQKYNIIPLFVVTDQYKNQVLYKVSLRQMLLGRSDVNVTSQLAARCNSGPQTIKCFIVSKRLSTSFVFI